MISSPRILIASIITTQPYKQFCLPDYFNALKTLSYPNIDIRILLDGPETDIIKKFQPQFHIKKTPVLNSPVASVVYKRNWFRDFVLDNNFDYLFFWEQDIIPAPDILENLLASKKSVISALYFNYCRKDKPRYAVPEPGYYPMAWKYNEHGNEALLKYEELFPPQLIKIDACGLAAVLIHKDVLAQIKFRADSNPMIFEEFIFARDCQKAGISIYLDTKIICKHYCDYGPDYAIK